MFTTAAIDNLDHHTSSAAAKSSFHGTTILVFQHADYHLSSLSFRFDASNRRRRRKQGKLPVSYKDIQQTVLGKPKPLVSSDIDPDSFFLDGSVSALSNELFGMFFQNFGYSI